MKAEGGLRSSIYRLFSCGGGCNVATCLFCDSTKAQKIVLKGERVPNAVYTEVVVAEPRPSSICFGWGADTSTTEQLSSKKPIVRNVALASDLIKDALADVITSPPQSAFDGNHNAEINPLVGHKDASPASSAHTSAHSTPTRSKRQPVIPWSTEFRSRSVVIEDRQEELDEGEVVFDQIETQVPDDNADISVSSHSTPAIWHVDDESHSKNVTPEQRIPSPHGVPSSAVPIGSPASLSIDRDLNLMSNYKICFGESPENNDPMDSDSDLDFVDVKEEIAVELLASDAIEITKYDTSEIPLTPYSHSQASWNGRLELLEEARK